MARRTVTQVRAKIEAMYSTALTPKPDWFRRPAAMSERSTRRNASSASASWPASQVPPSPCEWRWPSPCEWTTPSLACGRRLNTGSSSTSIGRVACRHSTAAPPPPAANARMWSRLRRSTTAAATAPPYCARMDIPGSPLG